LAPAFIPLCCGSTSLACENSRSLDAWLLSSSGNAVHGGCNGVYNACALWCPACGYSVYGTYDCHHDDDDESLHLLHPSLHPLSE
jgi:hypothetical protein